MSDELEKITRKLNQIRTTNAGLVSEIEHLGGGVEVSIARVEHFIGWICQRLEVSEVEKLEEQISWETSLKPQLVHVRDITRQRNNDLRAAQEKERARQAAIAAAAAPKPGKVEGGIWVPGAKN